MATHAIATNPTPHETPSADNADTWLASAESLYARGNPIAALQACRRAVATRSDFAPAYQTLGKILRACGKPEAADRAEEKAAQLDGPGGNSTPQTLVRQGCDLARSGQWEAAIARFQDAIALDPKCAEAHFYLGQATAVRGQQLLDGARHSYQNALNLNPNLTAARQSLQQLPSGQPSVGSEEIVALLAYGLLKLASLPREEGEKLLETLRFDRLEDQAKYEAIAPNPQAITSAIDRGNQCFKQGQFQQAINGYAGAIRAWIELLEKGQLQAGSHLLQDTLQSLVRESQCRPLDLLSVAVSLGIYRETGKVTEFGHLSKVWLHCQSNAYFNDFMSWLVGSHQPPDETFESGEGILGPFDPRELDTISHALDDGGYYIFPKRLPPELCDRLTHFALATPCQGYQQSETLPDLLLYNRDNPQVEGCYIPQQAALDNRDIQTLIRDPYFLAVAQRHLGSEPVFANISMWWSSATGKEANASMAQLYHFDMDWIKWTNFFIYLTDVTTETGPHCYVANTHHRNSKPKVLLDRGYARIPDRDLKQYYREEDFIEVTGLRGTTIVGDTRCYHKAKRPERNHRLIIDITYTNTLWLGGPYENPQLKPDYDRDLLQLARSHPRIFSKFVKL